MIDASVYKDAAAPAAPDESKRAVADLAAEMVALAAEIDAKEAEVKELRAKHDDIEQQQLPSAMRAIGMKEFTLTSGEVVSLAKVYAVASVSVPISDQAAKKMAPAEIAEALQRARQCFEWLRAEGFGSLIKRDLTTQFGMGQDNIAQEFAERVAAITRELGGGRTSDKTYVHHSTLPAFVRERIEGGRDVPDFFTVHQIDVASVKAPRSRKPRDRGEAGPARRQEML